MSAASSLSATPAYSRVRCNDNIAFFLFFQASPSLKRSAPPTAEVEVKRPRDTRSDIVDDGERPSTSRGSNALQYLNAYVGGARF